MRRPLRYAVAAVVAALVTLGVAGLSRAPYAAGETQGAAVRLAWRARGARIEECRRLTAEELQALPPHMRREEVCEGRVLPYHLEVALDGRVLVSEAVRAAGAHADRPLYVFRELTVPPGRYALTVRFEREQAPTLAASSLMQADAAPALLELTEQVDLGPLDVALVTYDSERRVLVLRRPGEP